MARESKREDRLVKMNSAADYSRQVARSAHFISNFDTSSSLHAHSSYSRWNIRLRGCYRATLRSRGCVGFYSGELVKPWIISNRLRIYKAVGLHVVFSRVLNILVYLCRAAAKRWE